MTFATTHTSPLAASATAPGRFTAQLRTRVPSAASKTLTWLVTRSVATTWVAEAAAAAGGLPTSYVRVVGVPSRV
ncbi:hypothetical protein [Actinocatenispora rupis]|uniref:hypothetical protein n=1 Tax=Actinocatenispora rupis TaxID=519421 RepID=UPI001940ED32|nr:hypothetical protein [Actinocatenispora rupis]